jgi:hypothetical protein
MGFHPRAEDPLAEFRSEILLHPGISLVVSVAIHCCSSVSELQEVWKRRLLTSFPEKELIIISNVAAKFGIILVVPEKKPFHKKFIK